MNCIYLVIQCNFTYLAYLFIFFFIFIYLFKICYVIKLQLIPDVI